MCLFKSKSEIPELQSCATISINEMSSIILDKLEEMGDDKAELYLADIECKIYNDEDVKQFLGLDETDKITFVAETSDCDDFAAEVFGMGLGLIWTTKHALNFYVNQDLVLKFVEPQQDKVSGKLEDWQGWDVRFFLSR